MYSKKDFVEQESDEKNIPIGMEKLNHIPGTVFIKETLQDFYLNYKKTKGTTDNRHQLINLYRKYFGYNPIINSFGIKIGGIFGSFLKQNHSLSSHFFCFKNQWKEMKGYLEDELGRAFDDLVFGTSQKNNSNENKLETHPTFSKEDAYTVLLILGEGINNISNEKLRTELKELSEALEKILPKSPTEEKQIQLVF